MVLRTSIRRPPSLAGDARTSASSASDAHPAPAVLTAPHRPTARLMVSAMPVKPMRPVEVAHRHLVGGVEDGAAVASRLGGGARRRQTRDRQRGQRLKSRAPLGGRRRRRRRWDALGVGERVLDREAHVGQPELRLVRAVDELHERVHDALGVDHGADSRVRESVQPFGLDDLERLVDEGRRVDGDLRDPSARWGAPGPPRATPMPASRVSGRGTGPPLAVSTRRATSRFVPPGGTARWPSARFDRAQVVERVATEGVELPRHEVAAGDERLLVRERHRLAGAQRRAASMAAPPCRSWRRRPCRAVGSGELREAAPRPPASSWSWSVPGHQHARRARRPAERRRRRSPDRPPALGSSTDRRALDDLDRLAADGPGRAEDGDAGRHTTRPATSRA